jgi:Ca2+/Na+ antiporter
MGVFTTLAHKFGELDHPDFDAIETTKRPARKRNTSLRIGTQAGMMCMLMGLSYAIGRYQESTSVAGVAPTMSRRLDAEATSPNLGLGRLLQTNNETVEPPAPFLPVAQALQDEDMWMMLPLIFGLVYMFWALAIVVDEFFVPALDVISDGMGLTNDVAGATLMAAGGSAPEFFTSLFSAIQEPSTATGFGTIVGSAVFNVLFVIAACALLAKETLHLTWWPLFRDVTYYSISLAVLAAFFTFGGESWFATEESKEELQAYDPRDALGDEATCCYTKEGLPLDAGVITMTEALILFVMYLGYVVLMKYQRELYWKVMKLKKGSKYGRKKYQQDVEKMNNLFTKPSSFRAGVLSVLTTDHDITDQAGIGAVTRIKGNVHETFLEIDQDRNGYIDAREMGILLEHLGVPPSKENVDKAMKAVDKDKNGKIDEEEFSSWYFASEARLLAEMGKAFARFDTDNSGSIDMAELKCLLISLGNTPSDKDLADAMEQVDENGDGKISRAEFTTWYQDSLFWSDAQKRQEAEVEEAEPPALTIWPPPANMRARFFFIFSLPLTVGLYFTVPNTRNPRFKKFGWAVLAFFNAILWIAVYSWVMVFCAETIGNTLGIDPVVMGVTILAAGTSVPDLLSSVIVARQGHGDMAVSSSIGSNIFDVLVGLPVPWMLSMGVKGRPVLVGAEGVGISIGILLAMLVAVIGIIMANNWTLSKPLAGMMMLLYVVFLIQDLARNLGAEDTVDVLISCAGCTPSLICINSASV